MKKRKRRRRKEGEGSERKREKNNRVGVSKRKREKITSAEKIDDDKKIYERKFFWNFKKYSPL